MRIKGTLAADVRRLEIKSDNTNSGREALVDIDIGLKREEAEKRIGTDFVALAFSTMEVLENKEGEDGHRHLVDSITPGRNCILERHRIQIDGHDIECQPELLKVKPVDGEPKVVARVRVPLDVTKYASAINALVKLVGQSVKVKFNPQQGQFEFGSNGNGNGHHGAQGEEAEPAEANA